MDVKSIRLYLSIITALTLITPIHGIAATTPTPQQTPTVTSPDQLKPEVTILTNIKTLIQQHQLDQAKTVALDNLKSNPNDVDVMLFLGIIYYQQAAYQQAELVFRQVLQKVPTYLDAKIGLARVLIVEKKYKEASDLINELEKEAPNNAEVKQIQVFYQKASATTVPLRLSPPSNVTPKPDVLAKIRLLMKERKLNEAKSLAIEHLKQYPKDYDVMLFLGLIENQQADYTKSELLFRQILKNSPAYLDAKLGLIRAKMAQKQYKEAAILIKEANKQAPQNPDVKQIEISYKKAMQGEKQKAEKKAKEQPNCIDRELANSVNSAMFMIYGCLSQYPNDKRLLTQMATVHLKRHLYAQSAYYVQQALKIDSTYAPAKDVLSTLNEISPNRTFGLNEIGLSSINEYVSDLHQNWDFSTLHYTRETWLGNLSARVNYAQREGSRSFQGEFEFLPIINPYMNLDLYHAFANNPNLFPKNASLIEAYGTIPDFFTLSLGEYYAHILGSIGYKKSTASISRDIGSNWLLFRVNHYIPNSGPQSTLYILTARHYFDSLDFYLGLTLGYGRSPDLANLLTTNFIVIRNKFINLNLRFPVYSHRILIDIGADHQKWKYPSGLDRPLTGATIGLSYRF